MGNGVGIHAATVKEMRNNISQGEELRNRKDEGGLKLTNLSVRDGGAL